MSKSNLKNFFKTIIEQKNFSFLKKISINFSDFLVEKEKISPLLFSLKNFYESDLKELDSKNLIECAKIFEDFFLEQILKKSPCQIYKNFEFLNDELKISDQNHCQLSLKKKFLNSFKDEGYFSKNSSSLSEDIKASKTHLEKEFSIYAEKNNFSSQNFEGFRSEQILSANIHHCIVCHERKKDTCRTGFKPNFGDETKENGCPLKMHISEAIFLKKQKFHIAALLVMMINNPLCILTGYRICNFCNKGCIFSKSDIEPVDVCAIESKILSDVLEKIDFGPEIYFFFLIFNPIYLISSKNQEFCEFFFKSKLNNFREKFENSQNKILIIGAGAAGISAAFHFFLRNASKKIFTSDEKDLNFQEGQNQQNFVHLLESNKIFLSVKSNKKFLKHPIKNGKFFFDSNFGPKRKPSGFGGVVEYGITNRMNKKNLDLLLIFFQRLQKAHKENFKISDSIFFSDKCGFGPKKAFENFDAVIFATGASKQNWPQDIRFEFYSQAQEIKPKNIFFAADFLIDKNLQNFASLQRFSFFKNHQNSLENHTSFKKKQSFSCVIIGFGLSAVDTASMLLKNFFDSCQQKNPFFQNSQISKMTFEQKKKFLEKMQFRIGILYRKNLAQSPGFKTNKEEIIHLLAGIKDFIEILENKEILLVKEKSQNYEISLKDLKTFENETIFANQIFIATGFSQNKIIFEENHLDEKEISKFLEDSKENIFLKYNQVSLSEKKSKNQEKLIGFIGDASPLWRGSVVEAICSGEKSVANFLQKKIEFSASDLKLVDFSNSLALKALNGFQIEKIDTKTLILEKKPIVTFIKFFNKLQLTQITIQIPKSFSHLIESFVPGMFFKTWLYQGGDCIHLTPIFICKKSNQIHFLKKTSSVKKHNLNLKTSCQISLTGPFGKEVLSDFQNKQNIFFVSSKFALYSKIPILEKLAKDFFVFSLNSGQKIRFYEKKLQKFYSKIAHFESFEKDDVKIFQILENLDLQANFNLIFDSVSNDFSEKVLNFVKQNFSCNTKIFTPLPISLGCSKGLCGKCFVLKALPDSCFGPEKFSSQKKFCVEFACQNSQICLKKF